MTRSEQPVSSLALGAGLATVYVIWGSTYLAIRFAVETLPPLLMAGVRFLIAGSLLYGWARWRGVARPTRREWGWSAVVGALLLLGGNGLVCLAETRVPSGLTALLVAMVPLWMVVLEALRPGGSAPPRRVWWGIGLGLVGVAFLVGPSSLVGGEGVDPIGALTLTAATLLWAAGSLVSRGAGLPASPRMSTALQMLTGGGLLVVVGLALGEGGRFDAAAASPKSLLALGYLIVFGALAGFSAYVWLLRVASPALVGTYAFVNPVVAVLLGWALAGEALSPRIGLAAGLIVGAVALITGMRRRPPRRLEPCPPPDPLEPVPLRGRRVA
ncbi:MAG: drug/metabolite exporter YedA [Thermoanaerobaculia bacterium]